MTGPACYCVVDSPTVMPKPSLYAYSPNPKLCRLREKLNHVPIIAAGGLWFWPFTMFWIRFFPPLRPFTFTEPFPPTPVFAACAAACCLPLLAPSAYFRPFSFERGRFYPRLGIKLFRRFAPDGDWVNARLRRVDASYRAIRGRAALREHVPATLLNERVHLVLCLAGVFTAIYALKLNEVILAVVLTIGNVPFNVYPVMHQRYKRARLRRA